MIDYRVSERLIDSRTLMQEKNLRFRAVMFRSPRAVQNLVGLVLHSQLKFEMSTKPVVRD